MAFRMSSNRFSVLENSTGNWASDTNSDRPWPTMKQWPTMRPKLHTRPSQPKWQAIKEYLQKGMNVYQELQILRGEGWKSEEADVFFRHQRESSDFADIQQQQYHYKMMFKIAGEVNEATGAFSKKNCESVLDLCISPGGFADYALKQNFRCVVDGTSLPVAKGGHQMLLRIRGRRNIAVTFTDITLQSQLLPAGASVPNDSPDKDEFLTNTPMPRMTDYGLVICDGQRLRGHEHGMLRKWEPLRLTLAQLIFGLTHVRPGGSVLVLLHGADHWDTVAMMYRFSKFSDIQLFKPRTAHRTRSSFYMVAHNVKPELAAPWVEHLKECWYKTTFGGEKGLGGQIDIEEDLDVEVVLKEFGEQLLEMGRDVWTIQKEALENQDWGKSLELFKSAKEARQVGPTGGWPVKFELVGHMDALSVALTVTQV